MVRTLLGLLVLAFTALGAASRTANAPSEAAVVGIVSIRVAAVWDAAIAGEARQTLETKAVRYRGEIVKMLGLPPGDIERITVVVFKVSSGIDESQPVYVTVIAPRKPVDVAAFAKGKQEKLARGKLADLPEFALYQGEDRYRFAVSGKLIVMLTDGLGDSPDAAAVEAAMIGKAIKRDADRAEMFAAEKNVASLAIDMPELVRSLSEYDANPQGLPEAIQPLLKSRVLTGNVSLANGLSVSGEISFAHAEDAAAAKPAVERSLRQFQKLFEMSEFLKPEGATAKTAAELQQFAAALLANATVTLKDRSLLLASTQEIAPETAKAAAHGILLAEEAAMKAQSQRNLVQIVMAALTNTNDTGGLDGFIENICDEKGKPLLSWRVRLLPALHQEELYKQFKLDEPWDSDHNKKLIAKMPKVFALPSPKAVKDGMTFYQAFTGKKGAAMRPILQDGEAKGLSINGIVDGLSYTILAVEAPDAVTWTKPEDIPFDPEAKVPKLGGHFEGGFNAAFCDGSFRFLKDSLAETTLKAIITANGGEEVMLDD